MSPKLRKDSLIVTRPVAAGQLRIGDIASYVDPYGRERLVTHQVSSIRLESGVTMYGFKGDDNNGVDESVPSWRIANTVMTHVPYIGLFTNFVQTWNGLALCIYLPAALILLYEAHNLTKKMLVYGVIKD